MLFLVFILKKQICKEYIPQTKTIINILDNIFQLYGHSEIMHFNHTLSSLRCFYSKTLLV